jgi:hypothetical protein
LTSSCAAAIGATTNVIPGLGSPTQMGFLSFGFSIGSLVSATKFLARWSSSYLATGSGSNRLRQSKRSMIRRVAGFAMASSKISM